MTANTARDGVAARWQVRSAELRAALDSRIPHRFRSVVSADDILQDAWLTVSRGVPDDVRNIDAWITTVVDNRLLDSLRVQRALRRGGGLRRLNGPFSFSARHSLIAPIDTPSRRLQRLEAAHVLHAALAHLSASTARVLHWRYFDELSLDEIERRSGRSRAAIRGLLYRAFQRLARCVQRLVGPSG